MTGHGNIPKWCEPWGSLRKNLSCIERRQIVGNSAIVTFFGMVSSRDPNSKVVGDLQLYGDKKVTLNHLEIIVSLLCSTELFLQSFDVFHGFLSSRQYIPDTKHQIGLAGKWVHKMNESICISYGFTWGYSKNSYVCKPQGLRTSRFFF